MSFWNFSSSPDKDPDFGDDDSSGIAQQPDHYPNVARPGGGYPEGRNIKKDDDPVPCPSCNDPMSGGTCARCDWGPNNRAVPIENFPLDPFRDDKAGIRAASWKFSDQIDPENAIEAGPDDWYIYQEQKPNGILYSIVWEARKVSTTPQLGKENFLKSVKQEAPSLYQEVARQLNNEQLQLFTDSNQWNLDH